MKFEGSFDENSLKKEIGGTIHNHEGGSSGHWSFSCSLMPAMLLLRATLFVLISQLLQIVLIVAMGGFMFKHILRRCVVCGVDDQFFYI